MIIANRIKELRKECGMTQSELAKLVGCSQSMVVRWEKGECEPTASRDSVPFGGVRLFLRLPFGKAGGLLRRRMGKVLRSP